MISRNKEVVFTTIDLPHYRFGFHQLVAERLAANGINYKLVHSDQTARDKRQDGWMVFQPCLPFFKNLGFYYQRLPKCCASADLVVLGQENRILSNLPLIFGRAHHPHRIAFFGHGKNYQSQRPSGKRERFKAHYTKKADWFFAYTDGGAQHLAKIGFPPSRITNVQNAIDMRQYLARADAIHIEQTKSLIKKQLQGSAHIGVFIGRFYSAKRLDYLVAAARLIRQKISDFQLVLIGDGRERKALRWACEKESWIHFVDGDDQQENALYLSAGTLQLAPGLVGLNILDGFAFGLPLITCANVRHSPEIEYLKHNINGLILDADEPLHYAKNVVALLNSPKEVERLKEGAKSSAYFYSQEQMAERFCHGVVQCLCGH